MNTSETIRKLTLPVLTAGMLGLASMASAEMPIAPRQPGAQAIKSAAGAGKARFDWLAKRNEANDARERVTQRVALGHGSWICSPAGFNRKSSCFRR